MNQENFDSIFKKIEVLYDTLTILYLNNTFFISSSISNGITGIVNANSDADIKTLKNIMHVLRNIKSRLNICSDDVYNKYMRQLKEFMVAANIVYIALSDVYPSFAANYSELYKTYETRIANSVERFPRYEWHI